MVIDIVFFFLIIWAIIKGYRQGLIIALFSVIGLIVGLAAAIKLSALAASLLQDSINISARWLPVVSFVAVFIIVIILVRLLAKALEKTIELAMLGWLNRLGGVLIYLIIYIIILSIALFYIEKTHLISGETFSASKTYAYIRPWGPGAINAIGTVIPLFHDMFHQLEAFFEKVSTHKK